MRIIEVAGFGATYIRDFTEYADGICLDPIIYPLSPGDCGVAFNPEICNFHMH